MARTPGAKNYTAREDRLIAQRHEEAAKRKEAEERLKRKEEADRKRKKVEQDKKK